MEKGRIYIFCIVLLISDISICQDILVHICVIPTYSMSPTLLGGDYILASLQIRGVEL